MGTAGKARGLSARELLCVIFKRNRLIAGIFLAVLGGASLGVMLSPVTYQASAILMVMKRDRGEPSPASGMKLRVNGEEDLYSASELLKRRSLLAQVVETLGSRVVLSRRLGPDRDQVGKGNGQTGSPGLGAPRDLQAEVGLLRPTLTPSGSRDEGVDTGDPVTARDQAILALSTGLKVVPHESSNLITITFTGDDPRYAATVLKLLVSKYLEQYIQMLVTRGPADFFEREVERLAKELREAEDALQRFEAEQKISSLNHQRESYLKTALERESALQLTRSKVEELRQTAVVLRQQLQRLPEKIRTTEAIRANPVLDTIRSRLLDLELERNKLLQKLSGQDRVADIEHEIATLRDRFLSESAWVFAQESYGHNPVRNPLMTELINTEVRLIREEVQARNLERDMNDFYSRLRHLDQVAYERTRLERKVQTLQEAHLLYGNKYEEAKISLALDQSEIAHVRLAEPVHVSVAPRLAGMGGLSFVVLGAIVGVVSGFGAALSREYFGRSFSTEESVRRRLGLPVLTSILEEGT